MHKHLQETLRLQKRIQLGKTLYRFLDFINRKHFTLILKMKILINCTGKFCYCYGNFQNTEAALTGGALKSFTKFTRKHLCQSLFFNKVADLSPSTLLKKSLRHRCFPASDCFSKYESLIHDSAHPQLSIKKLSRKCLENIQEHLHRISTFKLLVP